MSYTEYRASYEVSKLRPPFYAIIAAATETAVNGEADPALRMAFNKTFRPRLYGNLDEYAAQFARRLVDEDHSFTALFFAATRRADTINTALLQAVSPELYRQMQARYNAPGGLLPGEDPES